MSLPTINPEDARRLMDQGATLIDIRGADERAREFVPGSRHGPLSNLTNLTGVGTPIIFHCRYRHADDAKCCTSERCSL